MDADHPANGVPIPRRSTADPRFSPRTFRFTDYEDSRELGEAVRHIAPLGTPKQEVDKILVRAGARISSYVPASEERTPPNLYYYSQVNLRARAYCAVFICSAEDVGWEVAIYYDDQDKVTKIIAINP